MNNQVPWNFSVASGDSEKGQSSRNENSFDFLESSASQLPTSWHQTSHSLDTDVDDFSDVFGNLMDVELSAASSAHFPSSLVSKLETSSCEHDKGQSSGMVKKPDKIVLRKCLCDATEISEGMERKPDNRPKRTHSAEVHNQSERRRRDRINKRLKSLKELVPNCNKSDRASVLDDAVNYVKALRHQLEMMSAQGGAIFQSPFMSPSGHQSTEVPQISPNVPISPKLGMGSGIGTGMVDVLFSWSSRDIIGSLGQSASFISSRCRLATNACIQKSCSLSNANAMCSFTTLASIC
ncbi:transcription factor PHYTOCHROME INTERACTING FACTOR-LIKE 15-like isoform X1 [Citrus sinensis]|uniref:transcription factor PHYTOCHROME INTERACTING FACTOR-LIKE 15-like isoform X1 n=1 Tax=Citrus sinensis TaxID=2711 RepID=UPI000D62FB1A|nr:transcription factor PHYTOCHROME INTERACTING FACTOR-LIKE 15-like isoform X1 [Citrus sinensis]